MTALDKGRCQRRGRLRRDLPRLRCEASVELRRRPAQQFGGLIATFQLVQEMIADMIASTWTPPGCWPGAPPT